MPLSRLVHFMHELNPFFDGRTNKVVVAGNICVYESNESDHQLLMKGDTGFRPVLIDPINRPGNWHNNEEFADIHTQSTRTRQFGGGANGGLDDRFDQILVTEAVVDLVVPGTYITFGNDGKHFNDSLTSKTNAAVSVEMARVLHDASDHLPVFIDLVFRRTSGVEEVTAPDALDLSEAVSKPRD